MKNIIPKWKRLVSGLLVLAVMFSVLPMTAYAADSYGVLAYHMPSVGTDPGYIMDLESESQDNNGSFALYPSVYTANNDACISWNSTEDTLDLWVYSSDMINEGKNDGTVVPYFYVTVGEETVTWYLEKITWDCLGSDSHVIMTKDQISAARTGAGKNAYKWKNELAGLNISDECYNINYWWTTETPPPPPQKPDDTDPKYEIIYNFNRPKDTNMRLEEKPGEGIMSVEDVQESEDILPADPKIPPQKVEAGDRFLPDTEAARGHQSAPGIGYMMYKSTDTSASNFYVLQNWKIGERSYPVGTPIDITEDMADENGKITLVADWGEKLDGQNLDFSQMPTLASAVISGSYYATVDKEAGTYCYSLVSQRTQEDISLLSSDIEMGESRTIQYSTYFHIDFGGATNFDWSEKSLNFTLHVEMDPNLKFIKNEDGTVTFELESTLVKPVRIDCNGKSIQVTPGDDGSFTVNPEGLEQEGKILPFDIQLGCVEQPSGNSVRLTMPYAQLDDPQKEPEIKADLYGYYALYTNAKAYPRGKQREINGVILTADWQKYFKDHNITDTATQFAYALLYAVQPQTENFPSNIKITSNSTTTTTNKTLKARVAQLNYNIVHEYWDGSTKKGEIRENSGTAVYAGDVIQVNSISPKTVYNEDTYTLRTTAATQDLTVRKYGTNTITLYYDLSDCSHEWSEWQQVTAPTCTEDGEEVRTCQKCGTVERRAIDALDHDWGEWITEREASYTETGLRVRTCSRCGERDEETIPMLVQPYFPPVTPTPTPVTPVTPTPTPGTNIPDEEVPLANVTGLDTTDHFAYIGGYPDGTVRPLNNITRAEVATIFFRLMTEEYRVANWSTTNTFTDAAPSGWYNAAISTAAKAGILKGYADGSVKPDAAITRAEFATIAARFISDEITDDGTGDFSDTANHWAAKEIRLAAKAGWVQGDGNRFRPDDPITRAEVMTMVNRMLDRVPDVEHMLPGMKTWSDNPAGTWYYAAVQEATNDHAYDRAEDGVTEIWTELTEAKDWTALEAEWAANNGASAAPETQGLPDGI